MIVAPINDIALPPIKIAIQPAANCIPDSEGDEGRAVSDLIINHVRLVDWHINHLGISRNNFDVAAVVDYMLLRRGLQVAKIICRYPQPLDGSHHIWLLVEERLPQFRRPI